MAIKKERISYTKEFKIEAVRLATSSGKSKTQVAAELGVTTAQIYRWRKLYQDKQESAFTNESQLTAEQQEIKRLKLEVARLKDEREILKKATAFFAKELN